MPGRSSSAAPATFRSPGIAPSANAVNDMVDNERLEVWLVPIDKTALLVPYRIVIGTRWGDLVVYATRFKTTATEQRAALD